MFRSQFLHLWCPSAAYENTTIRRPSILLACIAKNLFESTRKKKRLKVNLDCSDGEIDAASLLSFHSL